MNNLSDLFNLIGYDGCKHIILSAVLTVGFNLFLHWYLSAILVLTIGIAKEIYDSTGKGCCERKDIVLDLIGIIIGIL